MSDTKVKRSKHPVEEIESVVIRFAGDSGDGMQLTGTQFSNTAAFVGNDISTLPDFPAEIRAPAGSLPGVSAFQLNFSSVDILTPGDEPDVLVAMNPAALKTNLHDLKRNGRLIINTDAFTPMNLRKAGYETNPLEDGTINDFQVIEIPITSSNAQALKEVDLPKKAIDRSKNFWALGLLFWLYDRPLEPTIQWVNDKFGKNEVLVEANVTALKAGFAYADASELFTAHYRVERAAIEPGTYRKITGNEAIVLGAVAASILAKTQLVYASYPITPASDILHMLSHYRHMDIRTVQAEDEIAAMGAVLGAAFAGSLAMTGTSGPGLALKAEAMGLALMTELPCVIIDIQRAGPSTGMPTKTEQSDLLQAMFGRNGDSPVVIVAPATPSDCFAMTIEAFRLAVRAMMPTVLLSDGYLGNGAEPWKLPAIEDLEPIVIKHATEPNNGTYLPYLRDKETLARPWAVPGTPDLEHRIGGLEKADKTGNVSYDHENHQRMTEIRHEKVQRLQQIIPPLEIEGDEKGDLLVVGWGGTYGAIRTAVRRARRAGKSVSHAHIRYLNPFPANVKEVLGGFKRVLIPELNKGQLLMLIRSEFLVDAVGYNKVHGQPFKVSELVAKIDELC